ncbi:hypothetical protein [uncultured Phascolarctobacterium sp.]|uniref:hypothetical protein n=1 Tax=uncultured Phascolarctobacterium sp. TaxID=512296 RepID=UPI0025E7C531|nr:hypothetical protein [uncultured Phascolarctobacterium sp.]
MLNQIKNARFYLQAKLGQRGAEMVEYAIVLACIAAIGVAYYSYDASLASVSAEKQPHTLTGILNILWGKVSTSAGNAK